MKQGKFFTQTATREGSDPSPFGCIMSVMMFFCFMASLIYLAAGSILDWKYTGYITAGIFILGVIAAELPSLLEKPDPVHEKWKQRHRARMNYEMTRPSKCTIGKEKSAKTSKKKKERACSYCE